MKIGKDIFLASFILCASFFLFSLTVMAENEEINFTYPDINPFEPKLPRAPEQKDTPVTASVDISFSELNVEGIIWGTGMPQAVIDGEVYRIGDTLKGSPGKIVAINKEGVSVSYLERVYTLKIKKKQ